MLDWLRQLTRGRRFDDWCHICIVLRVIVCMLRSWERRNRHVAAELAG